MDIKQKFIILVKSKNDEYLTITKLINYFINILLEIGYKVKLEENKI